ncbi:small conductance mechanosensitive channel [Clostridium algifaecis]|uniref:Small conductance mechanosensitive channel n=1 Tax=Clostridium algifaecis TaxID=1472040 RepID=A0ABS4KVE4_9CLOT|nr:mechanosensitive ion channel domain-containing protein [Clostridium algifaecis]MBP2034006.1 small conductance mechanosensitive channel [Clostridium algifaecis]
MIYELFSIFKITTYEHGIRIGKFSISEDNIYNFISDIVKIVFILLLMYITIKIGNIIINRYVKKQKNFKISLNDKKAKTVGAILKSVLKYCVYFFGIFEIISTISSKVGVTSLTFASIGGVAVGFGAQSLIKDIINGFFILFEDQFSVGDYIDVDDKSGVVESVELRVTKIRDFNGDLHIIPNGLITKVTNHSKGNVKIVIDIDISYDEDSEMVISKLNYLCKEFSEKNEFITEGPSVFGITKVKDGVITIRVIGKTKPMKQWDTEIKLREEIIKVLKKENVKMPYKELKIIKGD